MSNHTETPQNLFDALNEEIERVIVMRQVYADLRPGHPVRQLAMRMIDRSLTRARTARSEMNVAAMAAALKDLQEYEL